MSLPDEENPDQPSEQTEPEDDAAARKAALRKAAEQQRLKLANLRKMTSMKQKKLPPPAPTFQRIVRKGRSGK